LVAGGGGVGAFFLLGFFFFVGAVGCVRLLPACAVPGLSVVGFWALP
jgi:hypothetical protein